jgi:hypothetical protein
MSDDANDTPIFDVNELPIPLTAFVAREMRALYPDDDFDWDAWKDEMKEGSL